MKMKRVRLNKKIERAMETFFSSYEEYEDEVLGNMFIPKANEQCRILHSKIRAYRAHYPTC